MKEIITRIIREKISLFNLSLSSAHSLIPSYVFSHDDERINSQNQITSYILRDSYIMLTNPNIHYPSSLNSSQHHLTLSVQRHKFCCEIDGPMTIH